MKPIKPQPDPDAIQPRFKPQPGYIRLKFVIIMPISTSPVNAHWSQLQGVKGSKISQLISSDA